MSFGVLIAHFFSVVSSVPFSGCTRFIYPFTYWRTLWLLLSFGNIWVKLLLASKYMFSIYLCKNQRMQLLYHMVRVCLVLQEITKLSSRVAVPFCISQQQWVRVPIAPHPHQHLVVSVFWILAILIGVCWGSLRAGDRGWQRKVGEHLQCNGHELENIPKNSERQGSLASHSLPNSQTLLSN